MKINFVQYLLLGVFGVFFLAFFQTKFMQMDILKYRGSDKLILWMTRNVSNEGRQYGPRTFTMWNLSHVLYFAVGSYLFPDKRLLFWTLGLIWELLEHQFNAMNPLDILWNTIGIALGIALRKVKP